MSLKEQTIVINRFLSLSINKFKDINVLTSQIICQIILEIKVEVKSTNVMRGFDPTSFSLKWHTIMNVLFVHIDVIIVPASQKFSFRNISNSSENRWVIKVDKLAIIPDCHHVVPIIPTILPVDIFFLFAYPCLNEHYHGNVLVQVRRQVIEGHIEVMRSLEAVLLCHSQNLVNTCIFKFRVVLQFSMDSVASKAETEEFIRNLSKQQLEGAVGFLKILDPTHKKVVYGSCIILNERTVLTLAQYVYESSTSSFFHQIQFTAGKDYNVYHVTDAFLLNPASITRNRSGIIDYAILKLDKTIENSITMSNLLGQQWKPAQNSQTKSQIQSKCLLLEEQLKKTQLLNQQLNQKVNQMSEMLKKAVWHSYDAAGNCIQRDSFCEACNIFEFCLTIQQYLYGKDSIETIHTLERLAYTSQYESTRLSMQYYEQIISICENHQAFDHQNYAIAHCKLGSKYGKYKSKDQAIYHLEQALHLYTEIDSRQQRECARELVKMLQKSDLREGAEKMKQKYRL